MINRIKHNLAEFLSFTRGYVLTVVFGLCVYQDWWVAALVVVGLAAFTDAADGRLAARWPVTDHWFSDSKKRPFGDGKASNDKANGLFDNVILIAIGVQIWVAWVKDWPEGRWFWWWVFADIVFLVGTLVLNYVKTYNHRVQAEPAEVFQGYLHAAILLTVAAQLLWLADGTIWTTNLVWVVLVTLLLCIWRRDRLLTRPESVYNGTHLWFVTPRGPGVP